MKLRSSLAIAAIAAATAVGAVLAPSAAWADTNPSLNQSGQHILAAAAGYNGTDCNGVTANPDQDIWVFVWPGNAKVGTITTASVQWDSNDDGTADQTLTYTAGGSNPSATLITTGTPKIAFVTPAGWRLEQGSSTVTGYTSHGVFNLSHTCAGTAGPTCQAGDPGCTPPPPDDCQTNPDQDKCNTDPCSVVAAVGTAATDCPSTTTSSSPNPSTSTTNASRLPVTGSSLTGVLIGGAALILVGGTLLILMRRRRTE